MSLSNISTWPHFEITYYLCLCCHLVLHSVHRAWQLHWSVINDRVHASYVCLMSHDSAQSIQDLDTTTQYFCRLSLHLFQLIPTIHCTQKNTLLYFSCMTAERASRTYTHHGYVHGLLMIKEHVPCLFIMYSNASVHDRTVASVWELVGTFL
jgi:hypothetical protein